MAVPISQGGRSQVKGPGYLPGNKVPKAPKGPGKPKTGRRVISNKPMVDPNYQDAFNLFRQTAQNLKQFTPQVNTALISQPYSDAQAAATSMSQGLANDTNAQTVKSQQQYGDALNARTGQLSVFAAGAGGGVAPPIEDRGTPLLAQQGQTNADAALQAGPAYNQLLERAKAGAIAKATLGRDDLIAQGIASTATSIPGLTQQNRQRSFSERTADQNYLLALGTQKDKETEAYRQYLLDKIKTENTGAYQQGMLDQGQQRIDQGATKLAAQTKLWNAQTKKALATGRAFKLNAIPQVLAALKPVTTAASKKQQGYRVGIQAYDDSGQYGPIQYINGVPDQNYQPAPGYKVATPYTPYTVDTPASSSGFSWARYKHARGILTSNNPGITPQQIIAILGPTPKTGKKK